MRTARLQIYGTCLEAGSEHSRRRTLPASPGGIVSRGASLAPDPSLHGLHVPALFHAAHECAAGRLMGPAGRPAGGPVIVYSNHPAWWDAAVYILAADRFLPAYESYAPIDAAMLEAIRRLRPHRRLRGRSRQPARRGGFPAHQRRDPVVAEPRALGHRAGPLQRCARASARAQARRRAAPELAPDCTVLPLAIEYGFWLERGAEAFIAFGQPMRGPGPSGSCAPCPPGSGSRRTLTATLDRLSADVQSRDPARFRAVLGAAPASAASMTAGAGIAAILRGRRFDPVA